MSEVLFPPWIVPEDEPIESLDEGSSIFRAAFAPGLAQRQSYGGLRPKLSRRHTVRQEEKAHLLAMLRGGRGNYNAIRTKIHFPLRGSFPSSELLSNGTFANGTTGYTSSTGSSLSIADRMLRISVTANAGGYTVGPSAAATVVQYAPLVLRAFKADGRGAFATCGLRLGSSALAAQYGESILTSQGLITSTFTPPATSAYFGFANYETALFPGDFFYTNYLSMSRCALVDNGPVDLNTYAAFSSASWTKTGGSITSDGTTNYAGQALADIFVENGATSDHNLSQASTVSSSAHDRVAWCTVKASGRNFAYVQMTHAAGAAWSFFNLSTGAVASGSTSTDWANRRAFIVDLGNGWYHCALVARKTGTQTSVTTWVGAASADGTTSYTGSSGNALALMSAGTAASSVPVRHNPLSSATPAGNAQSGAALYVKGLPASTNGLLLPDDIFEINGEIKTCTSALNSDAAGLGYLQFEPPVVRSPADNDPIIITDPMGKFLASSIKIDNEFGLQAKVSYDLEHIYE